MKNETETRSCLENLSYTKICKATLQDKNNEMKLEIQS